MWLQVGAALGAGGMRRGRRSAGAGQVLRRLVPHLPVGRAAGDRAWR